MELYVPLEFLKLLVAHYFVGRKREQALIYAMRKQDQRLSQLEKRIKEIP